MTGTLSNTRRRFTARIAGVVALAIALTIGGAAVPAQAAGGTITANLTSGFNGSYLNNTQMTVHLWMSTGGAYVDQGAFYPGGQGIILLSNRAPGSYKIQFVPLADSGYAEGWYGTNSGFTFEPASAKVMVVTAAGEFHNFSTAVPAVGSIRTDMKDPTQSNGFPVPGGSSPKLYRLVSGTWINWTDGTHVIGGLGDINFAKWTNLPAGTYTISYIDPRSIATRYVDQWFIGEPDLANALTIQLGSFENAVLDPVTLRGPAFSDVTPGQPFSTEITWMQLKGITNGNVGPGGTLLYDATSSVTRQSMAAFLYRAANNPVFTPPAVPSFTDVPVGHPFYKEIEWMRAAGISNGNVDGSYGPAEEVTRQAMAAFLYRSSGSPSFTPPVTPSFSDVPSGAPFYKEIEWLKSVGISNGNVGGTYTPVASVSRQAMAAFLFRQANLPIPG